MNGTIMFCSGWQGSLTPAKPLQIHDLVSTTAATWVLGVARRRQPPMTFSKDDHLRLDAAAVVVDLLWSWAPLHSGLGHDVPVFMTARRKTAQAQAYALPRCQLDAWHSGGLVLTGAWSRSSVPQCQDSGAIGTVEDLLQYKNYWTICRTTETMDKAIVQAQSWQSALHAIRYVHVNRKVPRGAMSIWQYFGHIMIKSTDGSREWTFVACWHGAT